MHDLEPEQPGDHAHTRMPAADRRLLLVESAITEFALHGLAGTTTDAIARRAGISQPYVVRLFGTKKALFLAAIERCFDRVGESFRGASADVPRARRLQAMGQAYRRELVDRERLLFQLHAYSASGDPEVREVVARRYGELWSEVTELTGEEPQAIKAFFATGMLLTVAAAIGVPELAAAGTGWACDLLQ